MRGACGQIEPDGKKMRSGLIFINRRKDVHGNYMHLRGRSDRDLL
jgi:hypothetical protein